MTQSALAVAGAILVLALIVVGFLVLVTRFYRKVDQGRALIINKVQGEPVVSFTGGIVLPIIYRAEVMDISVKTVELDRRGAEGLICQDNIRADIKVTFFVRVNKTEDDVLKVAQALGCDRASRQDVLEELFVAKFSEALKTVGKSLEFEQLFTMRNEFKDRIIEVIGTDLNGYVLDDAAIDYLEQTPLSSLDPSNILDAQGIRKITEITTDQNIKTEERRQSERMELTRLKVDADEKVFEQERRHADALAKKNREVATVAAREAAETEKVRSEERNRAEAARIKADESIEVAELNKTRQVQVADKDRERVVAIKSEQVEKDRQLEEINREREVELGRINKEKAIEKEKKEIAEVVRTRIAVDKSVAEEEERIKDLRVNSEAKRHADVKVIDAEASAQESLIMSIKAAEAQERAAEFQAKERVVLAEAELKAADIEAKAKIRLAEGTQAQEAASGLAIARVKEANAIALEKEGLAEARVTIEKMSAQAEGEEKLGLSQALVAKEKAAAEAAGIHEKAEAMKALEGQGWQHEEFRLKLDTMKQLQQQALDVRKEIAEAQAAVLGTAMESADIKIVGGDGEFFERFIKAVSLGQSIDAVAGESEVLQNMFGDMLDGDFDVPGGLKAIAGKVIDKATGSNETNSDA
ncbi:MAG: hypothetical protein KDA24_17975 [Deltaproteobacteria bacterium]|nr:hypothetical protein [Deltaproteobacteria bacterium]